MDLQQHQAKTVALKACTACGSGLLERDKFCRWCGRPQPVCTLGIQAVEVTSESPIPTTSTLAPDARSEFYRRVSGPLVSAVVTGALAVPRTNNASPLAKRAILALISIPIWLIIVLLSPFDAYAAVKSLARQA